MIDSKPTTEQFENGDTIASLLADGYRPADQVILNDSRKIITPIEIGLRMPWLALLPKVDHELTINEFVLEETVRLLGWHIPDVDALSTILEYPALFIRLKEDSTECPVHSILAKIENRTLHLVAIMANGEICHSSHTGSFDVSWSSRGEQK